MSTSVRQSHCSTGSVLAPLIRNKSNFVYIDSVHVVLFASYNLVCAEASRRERSRLEAGSRKLLVLSSETCDFNVTDFLIDGSVKRDALQRGVHVSEAVLPLATGGHSDNFNIFEIHTPLVRTCILLYLNYLCPQKYDYHFCVLYRGPLHPS